MSGVGAGWVRTPTFPSTASLFTSRNSTTGKATAGGQMTIVNWVHQKESDWSNRERTNDNCNKLSWWKSQRDHERDIHIIPGSRCAGRPRWPWYLEGREEQMPASNQRGGEIDPSALLWHITVRKHNVFVLVRRTAPDRLRRANEYALIEESADAWRNKSRNCVTSVFLVKRLTL